MEMASMQWTVRLDKNPSVDISPSTLRFCFSNRIFALLTFSLSHAHTRGRSSADLDTLECGLLACVDERRNDPYLRWTKKIDLLPSFFFINEQRRSDGVLWWNQDINNHVVRLVEVEWCFSFLFEHEGKYINRQQSVEQWTFLSWHSGYPSSGIRGRDSNGHTHQSNTAVNSND